jgi:predicted MPP superfamily phosphohydrolase
MSQLNIVAVSDIHLGTIVGRDRFCEIVARINSLQPDVVLLVGDIVDEDLKPVIAQNLGEALKSIRSKFGTIAITGNHEYIGGVDDAMKYLAENQVTVLRDSVIKVNDIVYIIGRDDWSSSQFSDRKRKTLDELMKAVDQNFPVILLDHQPFQLQQAVAAKVDLQLSGHTHHGQIWPLNYLTNAIYEVSWGYKKIGDTQFYVSCGVGTWGPPIRLGNKPEIVHLILTFQQ